MPPTEYEVRWGFRPTSRSGMCVDWWKVGGVKVKALPLDSDGYFGLCIGLVDGGPAFVVNTPYRVPVERWIFTVAHELAHLLLHLSSFEAEESGETKAQEKEANEFAGYFLMPDQVFLDEWGDTAGLPLVDRVMKVKRMFRVSHKAVLYRPIQLGQYDSQLWTDFPKKYRAKTGRTLQKTDEPIGLSPDDFRASEPPIRRAQEPDELVDPDFVEDRFSRLVREAYLKNKITLGRAAELLQVPLADMRVTAAEWAMNDLWAELKLD